MDLRWLRLRQLDGKLPPDFPALPRPKGGWLKTMREAIGMTTRQLATRLKLSQGAVVALEKSEANNTISLHKLQRVADALNCDVHYCLVPRTPLAGRHTTRSG